MLSRRKKKNKQLEDMFDKDKSDSDSYEEFEYLRNEVREGKTSTPIGTSSSGSFSPCSIGSPTPGSVVGVAMKIISEGSAAAGGGVSSSVTYSKCEKLNNGKQQHQQSAVPMGTKVGVSNGTFASGGSLQSHCSEKLKLSSENGKQAPAMDDDPDEIDGYCPVEVLKSEEDGEQKTEMSIIR